MGQTKEGAAKAKETMRKKYGPDFYTDRAVKGGLASGGKFKKGSKKAKDAGLKGAINRWSDQK